MKKITEFITSLTAAAVLMTSLSGSMALAAMEVNPDINADGIIDSTDAAYVLMYAAEYGAALVSSFEEFMNKHFPAGSAATEPETVPPTEPPVDDSWKAAYAAQVKQLVEEAYLDGSLLGDSQDSAPLDGALLYYDDDAVPELLCLISGKNHIGGLYTYQDGEVVQLFNKTSSRDYYIGHRERGNSLAIYAGKGTYGYYYYYLADSDDDTEVFIYFNTDENTYSTDNAMLTKKTELTKAQFEAKMAAKTEGYVKAEICMNSDELLALIDSGNISPVSEFVLSDEMPVS